MANCGRSSTLVRSILVLAISASLTLSLPLYLPSYSVSTQQFSASAVWGSNQSPILAAPGSSNLPLVVTVINLGPSTIYNVTVSINASNPLSAVRGEPANVSQFVPAMTTGSSVPIVGYYNISSNALPGVYNEIVTIHYLNIDGPTNITSGSSKLSVSVPLLGNPIVQLSGFVYTPATIYPGLTVVQLETILVDSGSTAAYGVNVSVIPHEPVYSVATGSLTHYIGIIPVGQPVPVDFVLGIQNSSSSINTTLMLQVSYNQGRFSNFTIPFNELPIANPQIQTVSASSMYVGDGSDYVTLTVKNNGSSTMLFAVMTMFPSSVFQPNVPSGVSPLLAGTLLNSSLGSLAPGETATATFVLSVSPSIPSGTYPLSLIISWRQQGSTTSFARQLAVPISLRETQLQSFSGWFSDSTVLGSTSISNLLIFIVILVILLVLVGAVIFTTIRHRRVQEKSVQRNKSSETDS